MTEGASWGGEFYRAFGERPGKALASLRDGMWRRLDASLFEPELPPAAWVVIGRPKGDTFVLASAEAAADEAVHHAL